MTTRTAFKLVRPDGRTRNDFRWPLTPGESVRSDDHPRAYPDPHDPCPRHPGDGLSVGFTAYGLSLAGFSSSTLLRVSFAADDVAAEDEDKARIMGPVTVVEVLDWHRLIRESKNPLPDLGGANLTRADLTRADLTRADLGEANLTRADLGGADLTRANLTRADLTEANLGGAYLTRANLTRADLTEAHLGGAYLGGAYLTEAYLGGAYLGGAYLGGAYLTEAYLGGWERGPDGYARRIEEGTYDAV